MKSKFTLLVLVACCVFRMNAQVLINENFNNPTTLTLTPSDWKTKNLSSPIGLTGWFAGNIGVFPAFSSPDSSYIAANYNNTTGGNGTISDWLITPTVTLFNGGVLQFATRTNTAAPQSIAPDRLLVYVSVGTGTDVGSTSTSVGTFTSVPTLSVNPNLTTSGYPTVWTVYTTTLSNITGTVSGRFGFRYFVTSAGPTGTNSSYIGLDNVKYEVPCPNPTLSISSSTSGICSGNSFTIGASGANTYTWSSGQNTPSVTLSPTATMVYTLTGSSTPACNSSTTVAISVTMTPNLSVSNVTTCPGTAATLAASGASSYSWSTGSTSATIVDTPTMNTTYTLTGKNGDCASTTTVSVALGASLSVNAVAQPTLICSGKSTTLTLTGASSYSYSVVSPPGSVVTNTTGTAVLNPTVNTTYTVTAVSGTCAGTSSVLVTVNPLPTITFTASPTNGTLCAGTNVTFSLSGAATYSWTNYNSSSSFLTIVTPTTSGLTGFVVVGTGTNGCSRTTNISRTIDLCTGIEKLSENSDGVAVFPNPFNNELQISGLSGTVEVYTALGQLVIHESFSDGTPINTSGLTKGIYILKAFSEDKKLVTTTKLIKN